VNIPVYQSAGTPDSEFSQNIIKVRIHKRIVLNRKLQSPYHTVDVERSLGTLAQLKNDRKEILIKLQKCVPNNDTALWLTLEQLQNLAFAETLCIRHVTILWVLPTPHNFGHWIELGIVLIG
jgi:hypothetical protein